MEILVDDNELAKVLKIPKSTVHYYVRLKGMPHVQIGKHRRFNTQEVIRWFKTRELNHGRG